MSRRKLDVATVRKIRALKHVYGPLRGVSDRVPNVGPDQKELARQHNVSTATIHMILRGHTYDEPGAYPTKQKD